MEIGNMLLSVMILSEFKRMFSGEPDRWWWWHRHEDA